MADKIKVLLVDDEEEFSSTLAERLQMRGFEVSTASNGEDALQMIDTNLPDVMVLDLRMPGIGGIETLRHVQLIAPGLPVLLLTGYGSTEDGIKGMKLGASDYLMKPLNIDDLIDKMKEAMV